MARANWACLSALDLLDSRLSYAAMHQLVKCLWQNLRILDLSRSQLEEAALPNAMTALSKGKISWPNTLIWKSDWLWDPAAHERRFFSGFMHVSRDPLSLSQAYAK